MIFILGLLVAIVAPNVLSNQDKAMQQKARADIATLEQALDMYRLDNHAIPPPSKGSRRWSRRRARNRWPPITARKAMCVACRMIPGATPTTIAIPASMAASMSSAWVPTARRRRGQRCRHRQLDAVSPTDGVIPAFARHPREPRAAQPSRRPVGLQPAGAVDRADDRRRADRTQRGLAGRRHAPSLDSARERLRTDLERAAIQAMEQQQSSGCDPTRRDTSS
ncbi:type II secretion system protein G precursor [Halomonas elongata]|uniref:Type II secretion system protein G n=1 Tax=Halomonas elongata TaxID=2746 RepID=A0A1B8NV27_HALEL|nr:type II secretion system protein G precursor [Halomonas elongata]